METRASRKRDLVAQALAHNKAHALLSNGDMVYVVVEMVCVCGLFGLTSRAVKCYSLSSTDSREEVPRIALRIQKSQNTNKILRIRI